WGGRLGVGEVECGGADPDAREGRVTGRAPQTEVFQAQGLREEPGSGVLVPGRDEYVIESDRHCYRLFHRASLTKHPQARRSTRQSLHSMGWPFGNSTSQGPRSSNPSLRQIAFDGAFSALGNACMNRWSASPLAQSIACAVAVPAMPRPWCSGTTI